MSVFEIVRGVEGDCLVLDDTRICGPKPWGGGRIIKTFRTDGLYEAIDKDEYRNLEAENAKLRELVWMMDRRDVLLPCMTSCNAKCRYYGDDMCKRIESLMRELGIEVDW